MRFAGKIGIRVRSQSTADDNEYGVGNAYECTIGSRIEGTQESVGKSSVLIRYVKGTFDERYITTTIAAAIFSSHQMDLDDYRIKLNLWDTAGQERFRSLIPSHYRNASAALIVYDITSAESFEEVKIWVKELQQNIGEHATALCILGNKLDLKAERVITTEFAQDYATSINAMYFETSAATGEGISEALQEVARQLISFFEEGQSIFKVIGNYYGAGHSSGVNLNSTVSEPKKGCRC